jgi:hypothetical protein
MKRDLQIRHDQSRSAVPGFDAQSLQRALLTVSGKTFNQSQMDKTVERLTLVVSERGVAPLRACAPRCP